MASTTQAPDVNGKSVWEAVEPMTKFATLLIIASYSLGYVIVVINEQGYGFVEPDLLKPRAIIAGAVFLLFVALPVSITNGVFLKPAGVECDMDRAARWSISLADYFVASCAAAIGLVLLSVDGFPRGPGSSKMSVAVLVLLWVISANGFLRFGAPKTYKTKPKFWLCFSIACFVTLALSIYILRSSVIVRYFVWMVSIATIGNALLSDVKKGFTFKPVVLTLVVLGVLSTYTKEIFPSVKATWGGGAPLKAVLYLSKDSPVHPGERVNVSLFEESNSSFYITFDGETHTTYLPRTYVSAIEFQPVTAP